MAKQESFSQQEWALLRLAPSRVAKKTVLHNGRKG